MATIRPTAKTQPSTIAANTPKVWVHAPTTLLLCWLAVSLPLVIWDTIYVFGRPYTMEGGALYRPLYVPYKLYGEVDLVYGRGAFEARYGFTAAQSFLNIVETAIYYAYAYLYLKRGTVVGGDRKGGRVTGKVLTGRPAAMAVLLVFSAAVMTLSKSVLYWANEYFSGCASVGHNSWQDLILVWIIPNGAWLVFPTYIIYVLGGEILEGLTMASAGADLKME